MKTHTNTGKVRKTTLRQLYTDSGTDRKTQTDNQTLGGVSGCVRRSKGRERDGWKEKMRWSEMNGRLILLKHIGYVLAWGAEDVFFNLISQCLSMNVTSFMHGESPHLKCSAPTQNYTPPYDTIKFSHFWHSYSVAFSKRKPPPLIFFYNHILNQGYWFFWSLLFLLKGKDIIYYTLKVL